MTPLQTSSDPEVADWEKPLGAACFTRRLGSAWSGGVLGADWDRRPERRLSGADWDRRPSGRRSPSGQANGVPTRRFPPAESRKKQNTGGLESPPSNRNTPLAAYTANFS